MSVVQLMLAFSLGLWLGVVYFGGLWLTLRQLPRIAHPWRLMLISFGLRLGIVLFGVYLLIRALPTQTVIIPALVCMLGFLTMRTISIIVLRPQRHESHP